MKEKIKTFKIVVAKLKHRLKIAQAKILEIDLFKF